MASSRGERASVTSPDLGKLNLGEHASDNVHALEPFRVSDFAVNGHNAVHAKHVMVNDFARGFSNSSRGNRYRGHASIVAQTMKKSSV